MSASLISSISVLRDLRNVIPETQPTHDISGTLWSLTGRPKARPPCAQDGYGLICHSDGAFQLTLTGPSASSQRLLGCRPYPNSSNAVGATVNSGLPRYSLTAALAQIHSIRVRSQLACPLFTNLP
jgi:hypothetical protein